MQDLIRQEQFELEVLERLNSKKFLSNLVLAGGTSLRLCRGLNRFSVDLDFWIVKELDAARLFEELRTYLSQHYRILDSADKYNTLLFELRSAGYPRSLKIEIRKEPKTLRTEEAIAYSKYSTTQVLVRVVSGPDMMREKIAAFLDRGEVRDAFDVEFLLKKGEALDGAQETLRKLLAGIRSLPKNDFSQKLGSLLEDDQRRYYSENKFRILEQAIQERLAGNP